MQNNLLPRSVVRIGYWFRIGLIAFVTATTLLAH